MTQNRQVLKSLQDLARLKKRYPRLFESMIRTASNAIIPQNAEDYCMNQWTDARESWSGPHVGKMSRLLSENMLMILDQGLSQEP